MGCSEGVEVKVEVEVEVKVKVERISGGLSGGFCVRVNPVG